jgi:site-specific recombinase XerD
MLSIAFEFLLSLWSCNTCLVEISELAPSWRRSLRGNDKAERTVETYLDALDRFQTFLEAHGEPTEVTEIRRRHIEGHLAELREKGYKPNTVATRFRCLQQFFRWALEEDEIQRTPFEHLKPPKIPEQPVPVLSEAEITRLLKVVSGKGFIQRRDNAIIRLFLDTGMRLFELAALRLSDLDLDVDHVAIVLGKGRRSRACPFGRKTTTALDQYLRERRRHPHSHLEALWLGRQGAVGTDTIQRMVKRRGNQAGIEGLHPHMFRHTFAHYFRSLGGSDSDLARLGGWRGTAMLQRYGSSQADRRAREAHRTYSPGDRLG